MAFVSIVVDGRSLGRQVLAGEIVIGRAPECGLCVADARVSRRHLRLFPTQRGWIAHDLGSRNGTRIAGQPVAQQILHDGDVLDLGGVMLQFHAAATAALPLEEDDIIDILSPNDSGMLDAIQPSGFLAEPMEIAALVTPRPEIRQIAPASVATEVHAPIASPQQRNLWAEIQPPPSAAPATGANIFAAVTTHGIRPLVLLSISVAIAATGGWFFFSRQPKSIPHPVIARAATPQDWAND